jgi:hypothetical protein
MSVRLPDTSASHGPFRESPYSLAVSISSVRLRLLTNRTDMKVHYFGPAGSKP